jgi:hypothetical protein
MRRSASNSNQPYHWLLYVESPAMRHLIKKLNCDDPMKPSSRPAPSSGRCWPQWRVDEYVLRHHHPEKIKYLHPGLELHPQRNQGRDDLQGRLSECMNGRTGYG